MYVLYGLHSHIYKIMIINIMIVIVIKYLHFHLLHLICSMSFYYYYYNHFTYVLNSFFFIRWSLHMCIYMYQFCIHISLVYSPSVVGAVKSNSLNSEYNKRFVVLPVFVLREINQKMCVFF